MITTSPTVASLIYSRIVNDLTAAGVDCYLRYPPMDRDIKGSGSFYVVVLEQQTGWQRDSYRTEIRHPVGVVNVYADAERDEFGTVVIENASDRAQAIFNLIDPLLDFASPWSNVISCQRADEPSIWPVDEDTSAVMLSARYELSL